MAGLWQKKTGDTKASFESEVILAIGHVIGGSAGNAQASIKEASFLGADLGLSSIAVARLAGLLQKRFGRKPLPFHALFVKPDGTMQQDIRVSDLVAFLERHLGAGDP